MLVTPFDPDHRGCGVTAGVTAYPYIYFVNPTPTTLWQTVCVSACPVTGATTLACATNSVVKSCASAPTSIT